MKQWNAYKIIMTVVCLLFIHSVVQGQTEREYIRKGNRLYDKNEYAGSEGMYRRALAQDRPDENAGFNLGDALYKQGRFGEATKEFSNASSSDKADTVKQAHSFYNLGNSLLKEQKFEESIKAYINSLMLNPDNIEAKYNLSYAQDQLKKQEQQKQQQQDKSKNQQQDKKKDENKQDQNKENQQQKDEQQQQRGQDQQQPSISRDDARRLLNALAAKEKETQEKVQRNKAARVKVKVIKNW
jgi:Ca-activated chloride channel family protein